jgi:hypothetical protein
MSINPTSNSAIDKQAALDDAYAMGKREGGGATARANFYETLVAWSKDRRIDVSNSEEMWDSFDKGAVSGSAMIGGLKASAKPEETRKVRVSETRQFIKMGGNPYIDPCEVLDRAMGIIKQQRQAGLVKRKATDCMINVARAQNNDEQNALANDAIERAIADKVDDEKSEADMLGRIAIDLEKVIKKHGESDEVLDALAYVTKRIDNLGGTTKQQKARARVGK